jgi:uncharacterized damage-inducible protein DinB
MPNARDMLVSLVDYDAWASDRLLDAAAALSAEQLNAPRGAPERTVRQLLIHATATMVFWSSMLRGQPRPSIDADALADVPALRAWADGVRAGYRDWIAAMSDADLDQVFDMRGAQRTWWEMLVQVSEHAIHHRGEVASILTAEGASPGDLDYLFYLRDRDAAS